MRLVNGRELFESFGSLSKQMADLERLKKRIEAADSTDTERVRLMRVWIAAQIACIEAEQAYEAYIAPRPNA